MSWRLRIVHSMGYAYRSPVRASFNEARISPRNDARQNVIVSRVMTNPASRYYRYSDYWGTFVTAFDLHAPHTELEVVSTSVVETDRLPEPELEVTWKDLATPLVQDRYYEFLGFTDYVPNHRPLVGHARRLRKQDLSPAQTVDAVVQWVREQLSYEAGATEVGASAVEAWEARKGMSQDFVHLSLVLLRSIGIPARYVSGYVHPDVEAVVGDAAEGRSWSWLEAWTGAWLGYDPVSGQPVAERHVAVGQGRDYADVPPIKGIYSGGKATDLDVHVEITRLA